MFFLKNKIERHERNPSLEPWTGTVVESNANETTLLFTDGEEHTIPTSAAWTGHITTEMDELALPSKKLTSAAKSGTIVKIRKPTKLSSSDCVGLFVEISSSKRVGVITGFTGSTQDRKYTVRLLDGKQRDCKSNHLTIHGRTDPSVAVREVARWDLLWTAINSMKTCSAAALLVSYDGAPYLLTRPDREYLLVPILDTKTNTDDIAKLIATSTKLTMEELVRLVNGDALVWYRPPERTSSITPAVLEEKREVPTSVVEGTWENVKEGDGDGPDIDGDGDCSRTRVRHGEVRRAMLKELGYWPTIHNGRISAASSNAAAPNRGNYLFHRDYCSYSSDFSLHGKASAPEYFAIFDPLVQRPECTPDLRSMKCPICNQKGTRTTPIHL